MRERPILFSGPMVRAVLAGQKTQTRRAVKPQPLGHTAWKNDDQWIVSGHGEVGDTGLHCPYGQPGDRLWVRETWMPDAPRDGTWADTQFFGCGMSPLSDIPELYRKPEHCLYRATWNGVEMVGWKPSIHMPRWASRIKLEITGVRVERLQNISDAACIAEGIDQCDGLGSASEILDLARRLGTFSDPLLRYATLWEQINGPGSWDANPWVWVLEFRRIES